MTPETLAALASAISVLKDGGIIMALAVALYANYKRIYVWGRELDESIKREERWEKLATKATENLKTVLEHIRTDGTR